MRLLITTMLLFSCLVFAKEGDPIIDVEVIIMEIPPAGEVTSTAGTLAVSIMLISRFTIARPASNSFVITK
jgi:hypothetical protein